MHKVSGTNGGQRFLEARYKFESVNSLFALCFFPLVHLCMYAFTASRETRLRSRDFIYPTRDVVTFINGDPLVPFTFPRHSRSRIKLRSPFFLLLFFLIIAMRFVSFFLLFVPRIGELFLLFPSFFSILTILKHLNFSFLCSPNIFFQTI